MQTKDSFVVFLVNKLVKALEERRKIKFPIGVSRIFEKQKSLSTIP
jgi:hypothetical protein